MNYKIGGTVITRVFQDDISDGILDLNMYANPNAKAITQDALSNCVVKKIVFPKRNFSIEELHKINWSNCGIREFNVPENYCDKLYSAQEFVSSIFRIEKYFLTNNFDRNGVLKYSELMELNKLKKKLIDLCQSCDIEEVLDSISDDLVKEKEKKEESKLSATDENIELKVINTLKDALKNRYLWQSTFTYANKYNIKIDNNNNINLVYSENGDTYMVHFESSFFLYNYSVPLDDDIANKLNFLVENINVLNRIIELAFFRRDTLEKEKEKNKIKQISKGDLLSNPAVKHALRIRNSGLSYDSIVISSMKPVIDSSFFIENYEFLKEMGLIPFLDLGKVDCSVCNLEGLDLANSNIKLDLDKYRKTGFTLRNTNLENVPLFRQELNGIVADGANFKGTNILITPGKDSIEGAVFDETCMFFNESGVTIPFSNLRRMGYRIDKPKKMELRLYG